MALGGGKFTAQDKVLPGSYINFVSAAKVGSVLSDRGTATLPLELDWGPEDSIFEVNANDFRNRAQELFGYPASHEKMKGLADLFLNVQTLYAYRLNGGGVKASGTFGTAVYCGARGNALKVVVQANVDDENAFDVKTYLETDLIDSQTVTSAANLEDNSFVTWKKDASLVATAADAFTGGTNGTTTGDKHQEYLDKAESYSFNAMGAVVTDAVTKALYANYVRRMRDEVGAKFQLVLQDYEGDYEGVINLANTVKDSGWPPSSLVYWVTGVTASCAINASSTNKRYDGNFDVNVEYTQKQLASALQSGKFIFHRVGSEVRVLEDINSLVTLSNEKQEEFKDNKVIRVLDQIGNDIATLFNSKYLGIMPNDADARAALWSDLVTYHQKLQDLGAIEGVNDGDISVSEGDSRKAVVVTENVRVTGTMAQLYMTVRIS